MAGAAKVLAIFRSEVDNLGARPLESGDFSRAQWEAGLAAGTRYESSRELARALARLRLSGLPADTLERFPEDLSQVMPAAVQAVAAECRKTAAIGLLGEQARWTGWCLPGERGPVPEYPDVTVYLEALAPRVLGQPLRRRPPARARSLLRTVEPPLAASAGQAGARCAGIGKRIVFGARGRALPRHPPDDRRPAALEGAAGAKLPGQGGARGVRLPDRAR